MCKAGPPPGLELRTTVLHIHKTSHFMEWSLKKWSLAEIQLKVQNNLSKTICSIITCSDRYQIQSLLSPVLNFHLFVRESLRIHSHWPVSVHLWIMHLMLRNFPVKMRQMAHTTTYWQQLTGKQNREIQRNNRAARPNVVYEYMEAENCSSRMMRRSAECWQRHGWSMSACDWGFIQWSMDSLHLFASGKGSGRWGSLAGPGRAVSAPVPTTATAQLTYS